MILLTRASLIENEPFCVCLFVVIALVEVAIRSLFKGEKLAAIGPPSISSVISKLESVTQAPRPTSR